MTVFGLLLIDKCLTIYYTSYKCVGKHLLSNAVSKLNQLVYSMPVLHHKCALTGMSGHGVHALCYTEFQLLTDY